MKRIRVLVLSFLFPNPSARGYGVFVLNRIRAVATFCDVVVVAPVQRYLLVGRWVRPAAGRTKVPARVDTDGLDVHHPEFPVVPRYGKVLDAWTFLGAVKSVLRSLSRLEPFGFDVIDVHWTYPDAVAGAWLSRLSGKPFLVTVRGHEALYDTEHSLRRWILGLCLRRADAVVALSEELAEKVKALGVRKDRIHVILNGVDTNSFAPREKSASRRKLGVPVDQKILLSVGRLTEGKGHHVLIEAVGSVEEDVDLHLYLIGGINPEDDFGPKLKARVTDSGFRNIHFVESVAHDDLPDWYAAADLFCLASKQEGCPNVILEALACGTPALATRVGSVPRMIDPGFNGFLVEGPDPREFALAISSALSRPWDQAAIAARMESWSWEACARRVVALYEHVGAGR